MVKKEAFILSPGYNAVAALPQHLCVAAGEHVELCYIILPGVSAQLSLEVDVHGPGASLLLSGLYLCSDDSRVGMDFRVRHLEGGSSSRQLFKGVAGGHAEVKFSGLVVVAPDAQKTEACQENHNVLLSGSAHVDTLPQLEIYADDVKCSHGATIGQLSGEEQFYMRSRGIPPEEAKVLQLLSFLSPVLVLAGQEALGSQVEAALRSMI